MKKHKQEETTLFLYRYTMTITKVLEKITEEKSIETVTGAINDPDLFTKTLKTNQRLWRGISKLFSQQWNDDLKKQFKDKVLEPSKVVKRNNYIKDMFLTIQQEEWFWKQELWDWFAMKILRQSKLSNGMIAVNVWIPYKEDYKIKFKHTCLFVLSEAELVMLLKEYDTLERDFVR